MWEAYFRANKGISALSFHTVKEVADERMTDIGEMNSDLMRSSCMECYLDESGVLVFFYDAVFRDRPLSILAHDPFDRALAFTLYREIDHPLGAFRDT